jgi:signal transduction histidine kinase
MVSGADSGSPRLSARTAAVPADRPASPRWLRRLRELRLDQQFMLAGSLVSLLGMAVIGAWVTDKIVESVTRNSAIAAAMYMESFVAPLSQELGSDNALSPATVARLHQVLATEPFVDRIVSVKIWKRGGLIAFSTEAELIGRRFEPNESLRLSWAGKLEAEFNEIEDEEAASERARDIPLLEVYNPIHSIETGKIIAVAEFYQNATELQHDLVRARVTSWLVVGAVWIVAFALLSGIVRSGSRLIGRQHAELERRYAALMRVSGQNELLRQRIQDASLRAAALTERQLRRISADLHDGPAQALALASLRLEKLAESPGVEQAETVTIRQSLEEALRDIRNLCRGITLPELEGRSLAEVLELAVETHERRTRTTVALSNRTGATGALKPAHPVLICLYRFVQECLMNAFRHAGGRDQRVEAGMLEGALQIVVTDAGPAPGSRSPEDSTEGAGPAKPGHAPLGLLGLRERIEVLGGIMQSESADAGGTRVTMLLPLGEGRR